MAVNIVYTAMALTTSYLFKRGVRYIHDRRYKHYGGLVHG